MEARSLKMNPILNYDPLTQPWETNHIIFSLDQIREQTETISKKITEEGGQFRMLIPNSVAWTLFLLITMYCHKIPFNQILLIWSRVWRRQPLRALKILWTNITSNGRLDSQETGVRKSSRNKKKNQNEPGTGVGTQIEPRIAIGTDKNVRTETSCILTIFYF